MMQQMNVFFLIIQGILGGIGAIALIVAAFGIANTALLFSVLVGVISGIYPAVRAASLGLIAALKYE